MPPHLQLTLLNVPSTAESTTSLPRPQHVILNHIYVQRGQVGFASGFFSRGARMWGLACAGHSCGQDASCAGLAAMVLEAQLCRGKQEYHSALLRRLSLCACFCGLPATAGCECHGGRHDPQVQGQVHHISAVQATRRRRQQQQQLGSSRRRQAHAHAAAVRGAAAAAATAAPLRWPLLVQFFHV